MTEINAEKPYAESTNEEKKFPRGLVVRLIAYLVAGHLFAAFAYLLFTLGGRQ
ncbi:DUF6126 family protein [Streptomyces sp. NBC_00859]|uniref:DUF6126 family protein n=1 Tax=Streptomyces sp. NBC_00859 TaxID=2903682 RepID=UPI0038676838|nr:DUF6126 family protein [Streptomyces sp. NBC_00859]